MTEKKTKGKKGFKTVAVGSAAEMPEEALAAFAAAAELPDEIDTSDPNLVVQGFQEIIGVGTPAKGPDYHITPTGDILLDTGEPIPEDHPVHPAHRSLAAARKYCK